VWEGCRPIFADIDAKRLTLDPSKVDSVIEADTTAILATHVYGIPCDTDALEEIGQRRGIPVIYDAAHGFGATFRTRSLASYGTAATLSFHATKLFHTAEGGAVVTDNPDLAARLRSMRSFGHQGSETYASVGINAKNSELHAAMGLTVLPHLRQLLAARKEIDMVYREVLSKAPVTFPEMPSEGKGNFAYFPVLFANEEALLKSRAFLLKEGIETRRYFFPLLSRLPYVQANLLPIAEGASKRVLCLPMYADLPLYDVRRIAEQLIYALRND
jgi:dTDP-4-amino-4,6-dideoxygalactose transaminase